MTLRERSQKIFDDLQANFGGGMSADFAERAVSIIERHLQEMQQEGWISVEGGGLPKKSGQYLCVILWEDGPDYDCCNFVDGSFWCYGDATASVTHWRELPTPPKGERPA